MTPNFSGSKDDFNKFFSGFSRNLVQRISKSYKNKIGKCEFCGATDVELDSALVLKDFRALSKLKTSSSLKCLFKLFQRFWSALRSPLESCRKILSSS